MFLYQIDENTTRQYHAHLWLSGVVDAALWLKGVNDTA